MRIGIIGAGKIGSTLAHLLADAGHDVAIANSRGPGTLRDLEKELGEHGHAVTAEEAARYGDIVVVTVPFGHYREYGREGGAGERYGIPVAGDDPAATKQVFDLIEQLGYEPVDAGDLSDSRKFQPGTDVYTADLRAEDLRARVGI